MKLLLTLALAITAVGCGYSSSSHSITPPAPGTTPVISSLVPPSANHGAPAFTLEVDGSHFNSQATVSFNNVSYAATMMASGQLQVMIPAAAVANAGTVPVTVTNPGTQGGIYGGGTQPATSQPMNFMIN